MVDSRLADALRRYLAAGTTDRIATPRPAATVVLARDGGCGLEVLLLERPASMCFAASKTVSPVALSSVDDGALAGGALADEDREVCGQFDRGASAGAEVGELQGSESHWYPRSRCRQGILDYTAASGVSRDAPRCRQAGGSAKRSYPQRSDSGQIRALATRQSGSLQTVSEASAGETGRPVQGDRPRV
jgi:hypothetical protein